MANKSKKKVLETHGKVDDEKFQPTLLEQVWGQPDISRYGTLDEAEYIQKLEGMTRADIEAHARQQGVVVVEHTPRLKEKLIAEFRSFASLLRKPVDTPKSPNKLSDAAMKVLSEGR
jgi:hypothetical protein